MAIIFNRGTRIHTRIMDDFRASLKRQPFSKVPPFGEEGSKQGATSSNPAIQVLKDLGIPLDAIKRL